MRNRMDINEVARIAVDWWRSLDRRSSLMGIAENMAFTYGVSAVAVQVACMAYAAPWEFEEGTK
jgi:hypothetical protein